ncbi:tpr domain containing protein [Stylonychia lemnae]|uniref:Tetratricopeptide repeat protein 29 n=1 Tax=Stylonychia lemnae TaxID=5949 RepID=A0A077ZU08_STYLE|nr:tpr domain containing protein [Stylonychia lemnae]|eukprot:CDW73352.1 tpr domain containing protein [Stylonychia lemnae]
MFNLKANIINTEQLRLAKEKLVQASLGNSNSTQSLSKTLPPSQSSQQLFQKNPRMANAYNPLAESHKNITIKKILHEMERDLNQVEEENYQIVKEQAEQRLLKANPKLAQQRQKQLEKEQIYQFELQGPGSPDKGNNMFKSQMGDQQKHTIKKLIKDVQNDEIQVLNGQFKATIKLSKFEDDDKDKEKPMYTYQQHRVYLKKKGVSYFEKYEPVKKESDSGNQESKYHHLEEVNMKEIMEQKVVEQEALDALNSIKLQRNLSLPQLGENKAKRNKMQSVKQQQDKVIFDEVFINPRTKQLQQVIHKHKQQQQNLIQNSLSLSQKVGANGSLPPLNGSGANMDRLGTAQRHLEGRASANAFVQDRKQRITQDKQNLEVSALLQSKRLMEQSEKIFDQELKNMNTHDGLGNSLPKDQRLNTAYSRQSNDESEMLDFYDPNNQGENQHADDIVKIVMRKFNSSAKLQNSTSFFTQQIQVQPPDGLINSIGNNVKDASWAPSIPISTNFIKQQSLKDITLRAKAGVQAGDIQKEAHMAFALGNLNENEKNYKKSIKFYKRFFFCARILEDPVGASLGLNRLGVMYHKLKNYDNENVFASYYNLGISYRLMRDFDTSIKNFKQALEWSQQHQEFESECISNGQLGNCLRVAIQLKNKKLSLDCLLCLGYIAFTSEQFKIAKNYFHKAFADAQSLNDRELAEQCMCNMGIAMGNISVNNMKKNFSVEVLKTVQKQESEDDDEEIETEQ